MISEVRRGRSSGAASEGKESEGWSPEMVHSLPSIVHNRNGTFRWLTSGLGKLGNLEVVIYGKSSIYAKNQILKHSSDPLARSIAAQELMELLHAVETPASMEAMARGTANATIESGSATAGTPIEIA